MNSGHETLTRSGRPFPYSSIGGALAALGEIELPAAGNFGKKVRGTCIDDGTEISDTAQKIVPISGVGAGEDPAKLREILAGVGKIKPHFDCGKAALVLAEEFRRQGKEQPPTPNQVDWFACHTAKYTAALLGIDCGRTIGFNDGRGTQLNRPPRHHPASAAVIGLSGRFPHNFGLDDQLPPAFRLAGEYLTKSHLLDIAAAEALLAIKIASGDHGVGIVPGGFILTALVEEQDPAAAAKLAGLDEVMQRVGEKVADELIIGRKINQPRLEVVGHRIKDNGSAPRVKFSIIQGLK